MTFDPTKNDRAHGCLSNEERAAIENSEYGWEIYCTDGWNAIPYPTFYHSNTYRAKSAPKLTVSWHNVYPTWISASYCSRESADINACKTRIAVMRIEWSEEGKIHNTYWEDV